MSEVISLKQQLLYSNRSSARSITLQAVLCSCCVLADSGCSCECVSCETAGRTAHGSDSFLSPCKGFAEMATLPLLRVHSSACIRVPPFDLFN